MVSLNSGGLSGTPIPPRRKNIRTRERTRLRHFSPIFCGPWRIATGFFLLAAIILGAQLGPARAQTDSESATYTVTFEGNWNTDSTPGGVVGGAHFTTLIGAVHNSDATFWAAGEMATAGVERVAELGITGAFETEISNAEEGTVKSLVKQSGTSSTGTRTFEVEFSRTHPLLTLLSMIGPSPDWFVGVSGLSLLDRSDAWLLSHTVELFSYDAGTENGEEFSLSNPPTSPQETIISLKGQGKFSDTPMARLSFTLNAEPLTGEIDGLSAEAGEVDDGGGGCTLGGSDSGSAFGLFLATLALLLAVLLNRNRQKTKRIEMRRRHFSENGLRETE